jgi:hypothetical protein
MSVKCESPGCTGAFLIFLFKNSSLEISKVPLPEDLYLLWFVGIAGFLMIFGD